MPYYGVRMRYNKEVLIKAKDENEAEETARHADLNMDMSMLDPEVEVDCEYDEKEDADSIKEFKGEGTYAEADEPTGGQHDE